MTSWSTWNKARLLYLTWCTHYLGPGGWAVRVTTFPFLVRNLNGTSCSEVFLIEQHLENFLSRLLYPLLLLRCVINISRFFCEKGFQWTKRMLILGHPGLLTKVLENKVSRQLLQVGCQPLTVCISDFQVGKPLNDPSSYWPRKLVLLALLQMTLLQMTLLHLRSSSV